MDPTPSNLKLKQRVERILSSTTNSFADKYSPVKRMVRRLSRTERSELLELVSAMYQNDTLAALGFTYYGQLSELAPKVTDTLHSANDSEASLAIETVRKLKLSGAYEELASQFAERRDTPLGRNLLIAMFKLRPDKNLDTFREYLAHAQEQDATLVCSNVLHDVLKSRSPSSLQRRVRGIVCQTPFGKTLYQTAYKRAKTLLDIDKS